MLSVSCSVAVTELEACDWPREVGVAAVEGGIAVDSLCGAGEPVLVRDRTAPLPCSAPEGAERTRVTLA